MSPPRTVPVRRAERRASCSETYRATLARHSVSLAASAARCGVDPSLAGRWADANDTLSLPVPDLAAQDEAVIVDVVAAELLPGYLIIRAPASVDTGCDFRQVSAALRACTDACTQALDAWSDGRMDAREAAGVIDAADRAIALLAAARERARLALREGVIGVRRGDDR